MIIEVASIGDLRERIQVKSVTLTQVGTGAMNPTSSAYKTVWAAVDVLVTKEPNLDGQRPVVMIDTRFTVRYRADFNEQMLVLWRSRVYQVQGIEPGNDKRFMYLNTSLTQ